MYCASCAVWLKSTPADTSKEQNKNAQHHEQPIGNGAVDGKSNADGKQCVTDGKNSVPTAGTNSITPSKEPRDKAVATKKSSLHRMPSIDSFNEIATIPDTSEHTFITHIQVTKCIVYVCVCVCVCVCVRIQRNSCV